MASDSVSWPDEPVPAGIKEWISTFFEKADSEGEQSSKELAELFHDDGAMTGMAAPVHGKQAIYESRLKAWDTVKSRKHTVHKVYTNKKDFSDILILAKISQTFKNERSFEMEFVAQVLFADAQSERPKATSYKVWADKQVAAKAARGE